MGARPDGAPTDGCYNQGMPTTRLKIQDLRNVVAVGHLEHSLEAVPGVDSVNIDLTCEEAVIEHEGADPRLLAVAAAELGYRASII
jgi:hypothetical protein